MKNIFQARMVASSVIDLSSLALHESGELQCHDINMDPLDPSRYEQKKSVVPNN